MEAKLRAEKRKTAKAAKAEAAALNGNELDDEKPNPSVLRKNIPISKEHNTSLPALNLPVDALAKVMRYLPAREWGAISGSPVSLEVEIMLGGGLRPGSLPGGWGGI